MQFNKKKRNIADETQPSAPETNAVADMTSKPRTARSSKTKKTETAESGSVKHHHKGTSAVADVGAEKSGAKTFAAAATAAPASSIIDPVGVVAPPAQPERAAIATAAESPTPAITQEEIGRLAYSYWIARGYADGGAEQDWLRAERELAAKR